MNKEATVVAEFPLTVSVNAYYTKQVEKEILSFEKFFFLYYNCPIFTISCHLLSRNIDSTLVLIPT